MNFGKVFKEVREKMDLSQRAMAKKIDLTPSALWKIESGKSQPKQETIKKLCDVGDIPMAYFYKMATELDDFLFPPRP